MQYLGNYFFHPDEIGGHQTDYFSITYLTQILVWSNQIFDSICV